MKERRESKCSRDGNGSKALLARTDVVVQVSVGLEVAKGLPEPDGADNVEGKVLDLARQVYGRRPSLGGKVLGPDQVEQLLDAPVDGGLEGVVLLTRVLDGGKVSSELTL